MFGSSNSSHSHPPPDRSSHFRTTAHCSLNMLPLVILFDLSKSSPFTTHSTPQCFSLSSFTRTLYLTLQTPVTSTNCYSYYPIPPTCVWPYKPSTIPIPTHFQQTSKCKYQHLCIFIHFQSFSTSHTALLAHSSTLSIVIYCHIGNHSTQRLLYHESFTYWIVHAKCLIFVTNTPIWYN